jgi:hypothetical protein
MTHGILPSTKSTLVAWVKLDTFGWDAASKLNVAKNLSWGMTTKQGVGEFCTQVFQLAIQISVYPLPDAKNLAVIQENRVHAIWSKNILIDYNYATMCTYYIWLSHRRF